MSISRRELFTFWRRGRDEPPREDEPARTDDAAARDDSTTRAAPALAARARRAPGTLPPPARRPPLLRPPGALEEALFRETCHRCHQCIEVCPRQAIGAIPSGPLAGTPFLVVRQAPCVVCTGLQCTHACPSGALTPLDDPLAIRMGTAVVDAARCLAWRGEACGACVSTCPIPGAIVAVPRGAVTVPIVDVAVCVGCGLCENVCPPEPAAIHIVLRGA